MGTKRAFREDVHPSRHQNFQTPAAQAKKARMTDSRETQADRNSINSLKGKIRDLVRLLKLDGLPADVRVEKERALDGYQADLQRLEEEKEMKFLIRRYHMVRFFERQKAQRVLKQLNKLASNPSSNTAEEPTLAAEIHEATVDVNYTLYFPLNEKYHSLYPRTTEQGPENVRDIGGKGERKLGGPRPPLWSVVEQAMADGTLEDLREGKMRTTLVVGRNKPTASQEPKRVKPANNIHEQPTGSGGEHAGGPVPDGEHEDHDRSSDDGFFEE